MSQPTTTPEKAIWNDLDTAVRVRKRLLALNRSRKDANFDQAIARVRTWLDSHPFPQPETLRLFLKNCEIELDRIFTGNTAGNNVRARVLAYRDGR